MIDDDLIAFSCFQQPNRDTKRLPDIQGYGERGEVSRNHQLFDLISRRPQQETRPFIGFYPMRSAAEILEPHRELVDKIRHCFDVPESVWASTHEQLLHNFARRVQLIPASEAHHTEPGGTLRHALKTVNRAMKIRRGYLLPNGVSSEINTR
jgi:hypothetical protein